VRLIAGLGNPGKKYQASRHNLGFMAIDRLADIYQAMVFLPRFHGRIAQVKIAEEEVFLLKPYTSMNSSGISIAQAMNKLKLPPEKLIVIHDDMDLALGKIKIALGAGSAGHKGIASIFWSLHTKDFYRIRLGIGKPAEEEDLVEYVLSDFREEEQEQVDEMLDQACQAVLVLVRDGLEKARNLFHRKS